MRVLKATRQLILSVRRQNTAPISENSIMTDKPEFSQSGAPIYRHKSRERPFELAIGDEASIEAIGQHIERYVGPPASVFHELISDLVHLDVHMVQPTFERNYYTLITSGM